MIYKVVKGENLVQNSAVSDVRTGFVVIGADRKELIIMERLTKISESGNAYYPKCFEEPCFGSGFCKDDNCKLMYEVCKKFADYEDLEEQGLLLKLSCKVGDSVFIIVGKDISKQRVKEIKISDIGIEMATSRRTFSMSCVGKNVFLTRAEAEKKLKEVKEQNGTK